VLEIRAQPGFSADAVRAVRLRTFHAAYQIIGGGEEGDKHIVRTKEEADHSLPYILAVALIDGEVQPEQYAPARILARDVQQLLRKVSVAEDADLSARFPKQMPAELQVELEDGTTLQAVRDAYHGFHTDPFDWKAARAKFDRVAGAFANAAERDAIAQAVATLDQHGSVLDLMDLLGNVSAMRRRKDFASLRAGRAVR